MIIDKSIFRAYDIRGVVNQQLTSEFVTLLGKAFGTKMRENNLSSLFVARDGRLSGEVFTNALIKGLVSTGCNVVDLGMVPTPLLYFAIYQSTEISSGIMITGSHNPADYNGFKCMLGGETLSAGAIQDLYQTIISDVFAQGSGESIKQDVVKDYIQAVNNNIITNDSFDSLKIVVDCGHGVAGMLAPELFASLGCKVVPLFCEVDGTFPAHHPDPSKPENLRDLIKAVKKSKANIGLAFDGDGDRVAVVDSVGNIIIADRLMMLFASSVLNVHQGAEVIYDVKCSRNLGGVIEAHGGKATMSRTGHSFVKRLLKQTGAVLAGEMSGHIFFNDRWGGFDDGLYSAARVLELLAVQPGHDSKELFADIPDSIQTPEINIAVPDEVKFDLIDNLVAAADFADADVITIDGLRVDFADGWGLVRASNTTPCVVMRFEADSDEALERIKDEFKNLLLSVDSALQLPF